MINKHSIVKTLLFVGLVTLVGLVYINTSVNYIGINEEVTITGRINGLNEKSTFLSYSFVDTVMNVSSISTYEEVIWSFNLYMRGIVIRCKLTITAEPVMRPGHVSKISQFFSYINGDIASIRGYYTGEIFLLIPTGF